MPPDPARARRGVDRALEAGPRPAGTPPDPDRLADLEAARRIPRSIAALAAQADPEDLDGPGDELTLDDVVAARYPVGVDVDVTPDDEAAP